MANPSGLSKPFITLVCLTGCVSFNFRHSIVSKL